MSGSVTIPANDGRPRKSEPLFWPNNVYDALTPVAQAEVCDSEFFDIVLQGYALCSGVGFLDEGLDVLEVLPGCSRNVLGTVSVFDPHKLL